MINVLNITPFEGFYSAPSRRLLRSQERSRSQHG